VPTIPRAAGLRCVIFTDDHRPAHVHAIGADGEAKIELGAPGRAPALVWVRGAMRNADVRFAFAEVARHQDAMREAWRRIHGEDAR
jgi:hypothetical protein